MSRMLSGIETLEQHQALLEDDPDAILVKMIERFGKNSMKSIRNTHADSQHIQKQIH